MMERRQIPWSAIAGALLAFLVVRALRSSDPRTRITREVNGYLKNLDKARPVEPRRRGWGSLITPVAIYFVSRWLASNQRARTERRAAGFDRVARQESRPTVREQARGTVMVFDAPEPFSENLRPEEKAAGPFTGETDDLKVIEGIGPAISDLLDKYGIRTYHALAAADVNRLESILGSAGIRNLSNPESWPEQARLAEQGNWDELHELQNRLKAGRRTA